MPELLQTLAEQERHHFAELRTTFEEVLRDLGTAPESQRLGQALDAAQVVAFFVTKAADATEWWMTTVENALREGMSGEVLSVHSKFGSEFLRGQLAIAELAGQLWDSAEKLGAALDLVAAGRCNVAAARGRILAVKSRTDRLTRLVKAPPPAIAPADIERGADAIRRGEFLTPEQAVEHFRRIRE